MLHGPYDPPRIRSGDTLFDERFGWIKTGGYTNAPIPWPRILKTGRHAPILCGRLIDAVKSESEIAVAHHWGVGLTTVWSWRKTLGIGRINEGTSRLYQEYKPEKLTDERAKLGRVAANTVETRKAKSERMRGKPIHLNAATALRLSIKKPKRKSHRQSLSKAHQWITLSRFSAFRSPEWIAREQSALNAIQIAPPPSRGRRWLAEEIDLLGFAPDSILAKLLGRTRKQIAMARQVRGIPAWTRRENS